MRDSSTRLLLVASLLITVSLADPISIAFGTIAALGGGAFYAFRNEVKCKLYECCRPPYVQPHFENMTAELSELVYGQHLVQETLIPALKSHFQHQPAKPLVLSFHGVTGSGKNHVSRIIVKNLMQKGMRSSFVHHIVATADFPDKSRVQVYQLELQKRLIQSVSECERSIFIFDEVDKLPESLLGAIKPFLDYYDRVGGVDFRNSIFIFLSNAGGEAISRAAIDHRAAGLPRSKLKVAALERIVSAHVYNTEGGLKMSELISNHLIDHFIPFLPLEVEHVKRCIQFYLNSRHANAGEDKDLVQEVLSSLQFYPSSDPVFSASGCKRVQQKADVALYNRRKASHQLEGKGREHDEI